MPFDFLQTPQVRERKAACHCEGSRKLLPIHWVNLGRNASANEILQPPHYTMGVDNIWKQNHLALIGWGSLHFAAGLDMVEVHMAWLTPTWHVGLRFWGWKTLLQEPHNLKMYNVMIWSNKMFKFVHHSYYPLFTCRTMQVNQLNLLILLLTT